MHVRRTCVPSFHEFPKKTSGFVSRAIAQCQEDSAYGLRHWVALKLTRRSSGTEFANRVVKRFVLTVPSGNLSPERNTFKPTCCFTPWHSAAGVATCIHNVCSRLGSRTRSGMPHVLLRRAVVALGVVVLQGVS